MTTRRKQRKWTPAERSAIIEYLRMRQVDAETARDKMRSGVGKESPQWVWNNITYWDSVARGYGWGLSLIARKGKDDAGVSSRGKDRSSN